MDATQGHRGRRGLQNKPDTNAARRKDMLPGDGTAGPHERPAVAEGLRTLSARDRARETGPVRGAPTSVAGQVAGCVSA